MVISRETRNQALSLMILASNELSLGIAIGWLSPTLVKLQHSNELKAKSHEITWLVSIEYASGILGALFTAFALDVFGRKILLSSTAFVFFFMWVANALAKSMLVLCIVRFVFGFFAAINDCTNAIYLAENISPKVRGIFGSLCVTFYYVGISVEYAIAASFSYTVTSIINAVIAFLGILTVFWIKEPVQNLLMKGNIKQAEKNFAWLHGGNLNIDETNHEFKRIKNNVESENLKKSSLKEIITSPANYKSLSILIILYALVGCTGYFPVVSCASHAFPASDIRTSNNYTVLFGIVQVLVIVPASIFIDRFNRRRIIFFGFSLVALSHAATAALYYVNSNIFRVPYFPWLIFVSITLFASIYAATFPAIFVILGELFPLSVKATGSCLSIIAWYVTIFLTTKIFLHIAESFGIEWNFIIYCVFTVLTVVFVYFFLPETKNKTLVEIQEMLEAALFRVRFQFEQGI